MTTEALRSMALEGFRARLTEDRLEVSGPRAVLEEARPHSQALRAFLSLARDGSWPDGLRARLQLLEWSLEIDGSPLVKSVRDLRLAIGEGREAYEMRLAFLRVDETAARQVGDLVERHRLRTGLDLYVALKETMTKRPEGAASAFE